LTAVDDVAFRNSSPFKLMGTPMRRQVLLYG
jgi:hypothetical protein